ncbi:MAG: BMC domain-containing protein [Synergistaceae bacterium]|jgi:microcompartment protein CcmL/EutN|nr:BMC domain-containing protein [Synergistaceae bacterium]
MALGLIEAIGLSTAMVALDAATKSADVTLIGCDRVIGVDKMISITLNLTGDVAAVQSAVEAGEVAGNRVGRVVGSHVIASPHGELDKIINKYEKSFLPGPI